MRTGAPRYLITRIHLPIHPPVCSSRGISATMASAINAVSKRFKLVFFVPPSDLEKCKAAIFAVGAGRYPGPGSYTECAFTTLGTGQFRPGDAANPHIGKVGNLEEVEEARVETLCVGEDVIKRAVESLKR